MKMMIEVLTHICPAALSSPLIVFTDDDSSIVDLVPSPSTTEAFSEFPWVSRSTIAHLRHAGLKVYLM
jgi:hypothetical protein